MKLITTAFLLALIVGCSSMKPVEAPAELVRTEIAAGRLLYKGDEATITTIQGKRYELAYIKEVTADTIFGKTLWGNHYEIPIDDVLAIEIRRWVGGEDGKTAALVFDVATSVWILTN